MKKLNKKGFTLVELLAVIVILALLMVVVANTALPAMNNTKKKALESYAARVMEQAKALHMTDENKCTETAKCSLTDIMGNDANTDQYSAEISVSYTAANGYIVTGTVKDLKNNLTATIDKKTTGTGDAAVTKYNQITIS